MAPLRLRLDNLKTLATPVPGLVTGVGGIGLGGPAQAVLLAGSFLTNGASDPVASSNRGCPVLVKRTSAGLYTLNFGGITIATGQFGFKQLVAFLPVLGKGAAGSALRAHPGIQVDLAGTAQVRLEDATGTATDLAAGADNRVNWTAIVLVGGR